MTILKKIPVFLILIYIISCSNKLQEIKSELKSSATLMNSKMIKVRTSCDEGAKIVLDSFSNINYSKDDIKKIENDYYWFKDFLYIRDYELDKIRGWQLRFYNMGILPLEEEFTLDNFKNRTYKVGDAPDDLKHEALSVLLMFESIGSELKAIHDKYIGDEYGASYCMLPRYYIDFYTNIYDSASVFSTNLTRATFNEAEWFNMGTPIGNPQLEDKWTSDAFIEFTLGQWLITYMKSIKYKDNFLGSYQVSFKIDSFGDKIIQTSDFNILLLSRSLRVLALSNKLKDKDIFKIEDDYMFLTQMKTNPNFSNEFLLTHDTQNQEIKEFAKLINQGNKEFNTRFKGSDYRIIVEDIDEVGFYMIGLLEKS